jgi:hypothetical protein
MCWCTPSLRTPHCGKPTCVPPQTNPSSQPLRSTVTTTLRTERMPDGSWVAHMLVTGLPNEQTADAAVAHMQRLFCGEEIRPAS